MWLDFKITTVNKLLKHTLKHETFTNLKLQCIVNLTMPMKLNTEKLLQFWISNNVKGTTMNKDWNSARHANYKFALFLIAKEHRVICVNLLSKQLDFSIKEIKSYSHLMRFFNFVYYHWIKNILVASKDQNKHMCI